MAYHPQTNELTERLNKTLPDMISMYVNVEHKNWDDILPYVMFAYNTARKKTTRKTPFSLFYGREVTTLDTMPPHKNYGNEMNAEEFTQRAEEAKQLARLRITKNKTMTPNITTSGTEPSYMWATKCGSGHLFVSMGSPKSCCKGTSDPTRFCNASVMSNTRLFWRAFSVPNVADIHQRLSMCFG